MQALGARVTGIPALESLAGVDGTELDVAGLDVDADVNWEQARSVTANVVLWPRATTLVMNRDRWRGLTEGQRAVLEDAARAAVEPVMERERRLERGGIRALCDRDFALARASAAELAALRRALEPVYTRLEGDGDTRAALERIRSLKEDAPAASTPACPSTQEKAVPSDAPVVGSWQVHVTREQVADAPRVTGERVEDNWGTVTLELGTDGSFEVLNDRFHEGPVGLGTWSIRGDVLTFMPGGTVSMGAGETWRYRWTLFRGSLVLRRLSKDAGPTVLMVAPLRRR